MRIFIAFFLAAAVSLLAQTTTTPATSKAKVSPDVQAGADRFQQKLNYIQQNGAKTKPDQKPTVVTEDELNDYFDAGRLKLPEGLERVHFTGTQGTLNSDLLVDFDKLRAGTNSSNPLLELFTGTHQVAIVATGEASSGIAHAHVQTVSLDGTEIPRFVLQLFVTKVLQPKYPKAALDSDFKMPARMDAVVLGEHKFTVTQK